MQKIYFENNHFLLTCIVGIAKHNMNMYYLAFRENRLYDLYEF